MISIHLYVTLIILIFLKSCTGARLPTRTTVDNGEDDKSVLLVCYQAIKVVDNDIAKSLDPELNATQVPVKLRFAQSPLISSKPESQSNAIAMNLESEPKREESSDRASNQSSIESKQNEMPTELKPSELDMVDHRTENSIELKDAETTTIADVQLRDDLSTDTSVIDRQDVGLLNPTAEDQVPFEARDSITSNEFTTLSSVDSVIANENDSKQNESKTDNIKARAIGDSKSGLLGSIFNSKVFSLNPSNMINGDGLQSQDSNSQSLSLVGDEKQMENNFKANEALQNVNKMINQNSSDSTTSIASKSDQSIAQVSSTTPMPSSPSSTTTITTAATATTTGKPLISNKEQLEEEAIFDEFFGARSSHNSNMNVLLDSIKRKLGFGAKSMPPVELKQKLQAEIENLKVPLAAPVVQPVVQPVDQLPIIVSSSPAPYNADYTSANYESVSIKNPNYLSYDEVKKQLDLEATKNQIESTYPSDAKVTETVKKPLEYVDKLKGQINGPKEVPALATLPSSSSKKAKLDYNEFEEPEFRSDSIRMGKVTPFNTIPALSRYNKVVSSVRNGFGSLTSPRNDPIMPLYGYYKN